MNWKKESVIHRTLCTTCISIIILICGACAPEINNHGNVPNPDFVNNVKVGKSNRIDVNKMLGPPSVAATFDNKTWYYVGSQASQRAFLNPTLLGRHILIIHFNKKGIVRKIERLSKEDGRAVHIVRRKTPTSGKELTILEQLIGNIGRFGNQGSGADGAR